MNQHKSPFNLKLLLQVVLPLGVGSLLWSRGHVPGAAVLGAVGLVMLVAGCCLPALYRRLDRFGQWLGQGLATALTWALLAPTFYLVFVPGRILLKLRGIDPMCRAFPGKEATYWVRRKPVASKEEYKRQF